MEEGKKRKAFDQRLIKREREKENTLQLTNRESIIMHF